MEIAEFREVAANKGFSQEAINEIVADYLAAVKKGGIAIPLECNLLIEPNSGFITDPPLGPIAGLPDKQA